MILVRCCSFVALTASLLAQAPSPIPGDRKAPNPVDTKVETTLAGPPGVALPRGLLRSGPAPGALPVVPTGIAHDRVDGVAWAHGER
jgi:hypothetical protein